MKIIIGLLFILFMLSPSLPTQAADKKESYVFKAKILEISITHFVNNSPIYNYDYELFKNRKDGAKFVTGIDSHWMVKMEVLETNSDSNILKKGEKIIFIVHSPIRDIGYSVDEIKGKVANLELLITHEKNGMVWLSIHRYFEKL